MCEGGALGPSMWREFTNELPESIRCKPEPPLCDSQEGPKPDLTGTHEGRNLKTASQMTEGEPKPPESQMQDWSLDTWVDTKEKRSSMTES